MKKLKYHIDDFDHESTVEEHITIPNDMLFYQYRKDKKDSSFRYYYNTVYPYNSTLWELLKYQSDEELKGCRFYNFLNTYIIGVLNLNSCNGIYELEEEYTTSKRFTLFDDSEYYFREVCENIEYKALTNIQMSYALTISETYKIDSKYLHNAIKNKPGYIPILEECEKRKKEIKDILPLNDINILSLCGDSFLVFKNSYDFNTLSRNSIGFKDLVIGLTKEYIKFDVFFDKLNTETLTKSNKYRLIPKSIFNEYLKRTYHKLTKFQSYE